ncbi:MAG: TonB-dependent receptor domain-containing protein [Gemmatimonadaceae bacterium]
MTPPRRRTLRLALAAALALVLPPLATNADAQGVTTGAITGTVTTEQGQPLEGAQIQIVSRATGFTSGAMTRANGVYYVQGLEVGGPYTVRARRIGYEPSEINDVRVILSQAARVDFRLVQQATRLGAVTVTATPAEISPTAQGTKTTVSDTVIQRLPTLTRNLTDFIRLTPQVSQSGPGFSGGGMSNRMNNVQIDGATERDVFGLGSTGQPGGQVSARAISLEAVKEFQVLLAPFDVRQGNFGGLLLNAVTKSGTNDWTGSAFYYYRNQDYGRDVPVLRATAFDRAQVGFSLGGPIIRDKLHFFTANEFQDENTPVTGPFFGQPATATTPFPIAAGDIQRFESILQTRYQFNPGTAAALNAPQPMTNIFARTDYQLSDAHRLVLRYNFTNTTKENRTQSGRSATTVVYGSNLHDLSHKKHAPVVQLFSNFRNGWSNELFVGADLVEDRRTPPTRFPQITVNQVPTGSGNRIIAGADQFSQGNELDAYTYEITNNLTIPRGNHSFVIGTRNELVKIRNQFTQSSYGVWSFQTLDSLDAGNPRSFRRAFVLKDEGNVYFDALQTALYAQDQWTMTPRVTLTFGLRADISNFLTDNSYALAIDTAYGHHETPTSAVQFSPRFGFNWDVTGDHVNQIRGGAGLFVGTPPYVWLENAYVNNGQIITFLNCTGGTADPAPAFTPEPPLPETCRNGQGSRPIGAVNFLDRDLKFPQPLRANLAYDRLFTQNIVATVEGLYSRTLNQLFFVNRNLAGPVGMDARGRVMYGTIATNGRSTQRLPQAVADNGGTARFSEAFDIENQNKDFSYSLTAQLQKRYSRNWEGMIAYTFSRSRDVQSFTSSTHISNWQFGRTLSGRQEDAYTGISLFDQPHKIVGYGTYTFNWARQMSTDITLSYQGVSGPPHDYIYGGSGNIGDLNADGLQGNDLVYVPTDARDQNQIRFSQTTFTSPTGQRVTFTPAQQAEAFEQLIQNSDCLSRYRGRILERNACRSPFSHQFDLTVRQGLPVVRGQRVALQLEVFNVGNLLNNRWGQQRLSPISTFNNIPLVSHVGMSSTDPATAVPIVTYNPFNVDPQLTGSPEEYRVANFVSNYYRLQLSARYSF